MDVAIRFPGETHAAVHLNVLRGSEVICVDRTYAGGRGRERQFSPMLRPFAVMHDSSMSPPVINSPITAGTPPAW